MKALTRLHAQLTPLMYFRLQTQPCYIELWPQQQILEFLSLFYHFPITFPTNKQHLWVKQGNWTAKTLPTWERWIITSSLQRSGFETQQHFDRHHRSIKIFLRELQALINLNSNGTVSRWKPRVQFHNRHSKRQEQPIHFSFREIYIAGKRGAHVLHGKCVMINRCCAHTDQSNNRA